MPAGVKRIDCPTRWIELQPRVFVKDEADLAAAEEVLASDHGEGAFAIQGRACAPPASYHYAAPKIAPNVASSQLLFDDPLQFWTIFSETMNENPPPKNEIEVVLPAVQYFGIELGRRGSRRAVNPAILRSMKRGAAGIGRLMLANVAIGGGLATVGSFRPPTSACLARTI